MTANTGSDQSTVDDGMSYDGEDKRAKIEVINYIYLNIILVAIKYLINNNL